MMGFIGIGSLQLKIQSRFDDGRDDYFLHYMLQKVLSFNVFDWNYSKEQEEVFDLAMFMFPSFWRMLCGRESIRNIGVISAMIQESQGSWSSDGTWQTTFRSMGILHILQGNIVTTTI